MASLLLLRARDLTAEAIDRVRPLLTARNTLLVIVALALWLRLVYVTELPGQTIRELQPLDRLKGDAVSYDSIATNLIEGNGYRNSGGEVPVLPPVYPTFLAATYKLTAHSFTAVRIAQAVLGAATCAVVYLIGRRAFNDATGLLAALLMAVYPWFIYYNRLLITETLFIFLFSLAVLAMLWSAQKAVPRNLALAGVLLALVNLTHSTALLLPLLFAAWLVVALGVRLGTRSAAVFLAAFVLTLLPWTARNFVHYDQLMAVAAHGGTALYVANNPNAIPDQYHYSKLRDYVPADYEEVEGKPFLEKDRILRGKAIRYIRDNPRTFVANAWDRLQLFWRDVPARPVFNTPFLRSQSYLENIDAIILWMFAFGALAALSRWRSATLLLLVPLQFSLTHLFFPVVLDVRSRIGAMGVVVVLAAFAVYAAWRLVALTPLAWRAVRSGVKERSWHNTWETIRAGLRS
jgi:4-amino-4-deoxy-L-arabinose transferase-like glycosyltransferase